MNGNDTFLDIRDAHLRVTSGNVYASAFNLDQIDIVMSSNTASTVNFNNPTKAFNTVSNIEVGTANLFVDTTTSNVGIGTNTPLDTLHVNGGVRFAGHIIPDGNSLYDIGEPENKIRDMYVDTNSLWIGDLTKIAFERGKMKFKRRKTNKVPTALVNLATSHVSELNTESEVRADAVTFAQTKDPTISAVEDLKLEHWRDYAKKFDETKAVSDIFVDNDEDYEAVTASEAFIEVGSNIFTEHSLSIGKTTDPTATLDVAGDLNVSGNLTILGTTTTIDTDNIRVKDPIIELGKDNTASPPVVDLGLLMTRPSGSSNVGIIFDESTDTLEIGYTQGSASDSTITMDTAPLNVNVNGTFKATALSVGEQSTVQTVTQNYNNLTNIPTSSRSQGNWRSHTFGNITLPANWSNDNFQFKVTVNGNLNGVANAEYISITMKKQGSGTQPSVGLNFNPQNQSSGISSSGGRVYYTNVVVTNSTVSNGSFSAGDVVDIYMNIYSTYWYQLSLAVEIRGGGSSNILLVDGTNSRVGIGLDQPTTALDVNGTVKATAFEGDGAGLTSLNASNISSGTIDAARIPTLNQNTTGQAGTIAGQANSATIEATTADTANKIAQRNGSGDIFARLFRSDYQNQSDCGAAIAFRNSTTDNYIRFCSDMGAVRSRLGLANSATITASTSHGASTIVQRTDNGYVYANYFNTTPNDVSSGVTKVCVETGNDGFIRHGTADAMKSFIGLGEYALKNGSASEDFNCDNISCTSGSFSGQFSASTASSRDKFRVYPSSSYCIGMQNDVTFGDLNDWAMTFQMNNDDDRGFWWGDAGHGVNQGAMALSTRGWLNVAERIKVGGGQTDTGAASHNLDVNGNAHISSSLECDGRIYADNGCHVRGDWLRVNGVNGLYFESYGGGWFMNDSTWIQAYNSKGLYVNNQIKMASLRALGGTYPTKLNWPNSGHHVDCYYNSTGHIFHINHYAHQPVYLNRQGYSDRRIKEDIKDIDDVSALNVLRKIKPKTYKYKLQPHKGTVYGFIAQDVREVLPYATTLTKLSAPFDRENFVNATILEDGTVNLDKPCNELEIGKNAYFYYESSTSTRDFEVTEIISPTQFRVRIDDGVSEWIGNTILVGKEVDDFHGIDKDVIFTVATAALQEVDRQQQADKVRISELETQLASVLARLDALESA